MTEPDRLNDRWHSREFPVLLATARLLDDGARYVSARELEKTTDLDTKQLIAALGALTPQYLTGKPLETLGGTIDFTVNDITERGRRSTGLWPKEDAATDALIDLLNQAADTTTDEDDASNLRKAGRLLRSVPGAVVADVTAALIRQQTGLS